MTEQVATVIRCADLVSQVYLTLESVLRQTTGPSEVVLVTDPTTPPSSRDWLTALTRARSCGIVHSDSALPGAIRNAGVRVTSAPLIMGLDAGDRLSPSFHESACKAMDRAPGIAVVSSWIERLGPGSRQEVVSPDDCSLGAVIGDTEVLHSASVFRREAWDSLGGFDESLPALEDYDFWLRVLHGGGRAAIVSHPLLVRRLRSDALYRRAWEPALHDRALRLVQSKHAALFAMDPTGALQGRELQLQSLADRYRRALAARDEGVRELESLKAALELESGQPTRPPQPVDLGELRRTTPVARNWGYERGTPIDRHYIERFLERHSGDIRGAVLEIQEPDYTSRFGGNRVTRSDVLDINPANPSATVISDLRCAGNIPSSSYDCIILTQTLHVIDDMRSVIGECARLLAPGGVLLATLPCASRVCLEYGDEDDFWRVTEAGARVLFSSAFPADGLDVRAHGNVLTLAAFLYGLACHELQPAEFEAHDPYFPLLVTIRAANVPSRRRLGPPDSSGGAVLLYHRVAETSPDVHGLAIDPAAFSEQMAVLRDRCHVMSLSDLVCAVHEGAVPARAVAVTFDDGYVDNFTRASPILMEYGVPATFFVATDGLGAEDYEFWWDTLEQALLATPDVPPSFRIVLPDGARSFPTSTLPERRKTHAAIYEAIVSQGALERDAVVGKIQAWSGRRHSVADAAHRRMRPSEVVALAGRPGHAIGAHTARHLMLPRQPRAVQRQEIEQSLDALESLLAQRVCWFAYPFGAVDATTIDVMRGTRVEGAVTCEPARFGPGTDLMRIPRFEVRAGAGVPFAEWLERRVSTASR